MAQGYYCGKKESEVLTVRKLLDREDEPAARRKISLDALHWKPKTLLQIAEESGKYLVGLKENQKQLLLKQVCKTSEKQAILQQFSGVEKGHGRIETRSYEFYDLPEMEKDERREDCKIRTAIKVKRVRNDIKTGKKVRKRVIM